MMSFNFSANNVCLLSFKNIFKFKLNSKYIHRSVAARKITPQEVNLSKNRILSYYLNCVFMTL